MFILAPKAMPWAMSFWLFKPPANKMLLSKTSLLKFCSLAENQFCAMMSLGRV